MPHKVKHDVCLRKYPYPYRCALAICSDIDNTRRADFLEIHKFLNTDMETNMGRGIGLEIGDSFWMFNANHEIDKNDFSYFRGTSADYSPDRDIMVAFIRAGFIDCLHTYGNFSNVGGFRRELAIKAIDELKKNKLEIVVWIDHGDMHNFQNIATPTSLGDSPYRISADGTKIPNSEYHADLTVPYGVKFIWTGLTDTWGQDRFVNPLEVIFKKDFIRKVVSDLASIVAGSKRIKEFLHEMPFFDNRMIRPYKLRDGHLVYGFRRYGRFGKDDAEALHAVLTEKNLGSLIRKQATSIIYVHLGKKRFSQERIFSDRVTDSLRRLEKAYKSGDVYVTTTSRLLKYCLMHDGLDWDVEKSREGVSIILKPGQHQSLAGTFLNKNYLQGMTFYTKNPERTRIVLVNEELKVNVNDKDHTGQYSISIPSGQLTTKDILKMYQGRSHEQRL